MADTTNSQKKSQFKKIWQIVSGIHYAAPTSSVYEQLDAITNDLLYGIRKRETGDNIEISDIGPQLMPFIDKLKQCLDVDQRTAWGIFCGYIENEYSDSLEKIEKQQDNFLKTDANADQLLESIWQYDSIERMAKLKIIRNLLELDRNTKNPYSNEYGQILAQIGMKKLRQSYIEQLKQLVQETMPTRTSHTDLSIVRNKFVIWTERKLRETIETLQILLLIIDRDHILVDEFKTLVELFKFHSFGRQQPYLDMNGNNIHKDLVMEITYAEIMVFMLCIDNGTDVDGLKEVTQLLDKDIVLLHQNAEHGPILLSWMLMNYRLIELRSDNPAYLRFQQYGIKAIKLGVFDYLRKMVCHPMYRDKSRTADIACSVIQNLLSNLCEVFDCERIVAQHQNIFDLFSELLKNPAVAASVCTGTANGIQLLIGEAVNRFPIDFTALSMISHSVTTSSVEAASYMRKKLENLPTYIEYFDPQRTRVSSVNEKEFNVFQPYMPFGSEIDFTIPVGCVATVRDKENTTQIQYRTSLNYFVVLHFEANELLSELIKHPEIDVNRKTRVYWGLKYLASMLRRIQNPNEISSEMVHPSEIVFDVFLKFKDVPNPPIDLLAQCLNVCTALIRLHPNEIFKRVVNLDFLPQCSTHPMSFIEYANGVGFDSGLVGYYLVSYERVSGRFEFLTAFMHFLRTFSMQSQVDSTRSLELPGLIFLLREVFPYINSWRFESEHHRHQLLTLILKYFCHVLKTPDNNENRSILRNTCVYSLLHLDSSLTLLRIVALGNTYLEEIMQTASNWMTTEKTGYNLLIQLSMTILMYILRLRSRISGIKQTNPSPLENVIYVQPKLIIPVVTGYMRNIFNRRLPILSCRLLRRFAIEFHMSLFACLGMDPSQIRSTFLERLENVLESDEIKIAVLEFIEACIEKQPGMTEAFFKVSYNERKIRSIDTNTFIMSNDSSIGILSYMEQYLKIVGDNANVFGENLGEEITLLSQIMSLFHSLWKNNMQQLVEQLLLVETFWPSILNPLFGVIKPHIRVYSQLFNIIGLELYGINDVNATNKHLNKTLNAFFNRRVFFKWVNVVLNIQKEMDIVTDETPDWLCRLQSFKDMFVIILRRKSRHGFIVPADSLDYISEQCLKTLTERLNYTDDMRPFIILTEMYLSLLFSCTPSPHDSSKSECTVLGRIRLLINQLAISYEEMHTRAKESILAITFRAINIYDDTLYENIDLILSIIKSVVNILCFELLEAETEFKAKPKATSDRVQSERKNLSLILSLNIFKTIKIICFKHPISTRVEELVQTERVFNRMLSCLNITLPLHCARKISTEILDTLISFANSPISMQLLYCDLDYYLWTKLLPPKELLQVSYTMSVSSNLSAASISWQSQEWWPIYSLGVQFVQNLLQNHGHFFAKDAITFVGIHEEFLMDSLLLSKHALADIPMRLIRNVLDFVGELVLFEKQWRLEHQQSLINLMRCVQILLDHAIFLLHRPKHLRRLICNSSICQSIIKEDSNNQNKDGIIEEVKVLNALIEIVAISCKSLLVFSPPLAELIIEPEFVPAKWQPLIEIQFNAPKLNIGATTLQLTLGSILNASVIFTRALNVQQFRFKESLLNASEYVDSSQKHYGDQNERLQKSSTSLTAGASNTDCLAYVDAELCIVALEHVLTLLASQSLLALNDVNLSHRDKQLIKRELSTELSIFHDLMKKRTIRDASRDEPLRRKKHGIQSYSNQTNLESLRQKLTTNRNNMKAISSSDLLRVNLTRKLHLESQQPPPISIKTPFNMSQQCTPIISCTNTVPKERNDHITSSTPTRQAQIGPVSQTSESIDEQDESNFCELSSIQLVDKDYLHFLSNLFSYICHTEKIT